MYTVGHCRFLTIKFKSTLRRVGTSKTGWGLGISYRPYVTRRLPVDRIWLGGSPPQPRTQLA
eukprot:1193282-Prorocentrum_minimum.AAC.3